MKEELRKRVLSGEAICPFCGSDEIEGSSWDSEGTEVWQEMGCNNCDHEWTEVYSRTRVEKRGQS
jgi:formate dehydrogenase maturation protein FdhE